MSPTAIVVPENAVFRNNSYTRRWSGRGGPLCADEGGAQGLFPFRQVLNRPISPEAA
jgi:hypothetical protein